MPFMPVDELVFHSDSGMDLDALTAHLLTIIRKNLSSFVWLVEDSYSTTPIQAHGTTYFDIPKYGHVGLQWS